MNAPRRIGVVGYGVMGSGIADACLRAGLDVHVLAAGADGAERARHRVHRLLDRGG